MPFPFTAGEILTATNINAAIGCVQLADVSGSGASFTLSSSIPDDYTHLLIVGWVQHDNGSGAAATRDVGFRFNSDSTAGYDSAVYTAGSTVAANENGQSSGVAKVSTVTSPFVAWIPNYTNASINKSLVGKWAALSATASGIGQGTVASRSPVTDAVTQIDLFVVSGGGDQFGTGTQVALYGMV